MMKLRGYIKKHPSLWMPEGSVRALFTLLLICISARMGFRLLDMIGTASDDSIKIAITIYAGFTNLASIMIGSYVARIRK